jgi:hypothetical protein
MAAETGIEPNIVRQSEWRVLRFFKEELGEMIARLSRSRHTATEAQERDPRPRQGGGCDQPNRPPTL